MVWQSVQHPASAHTWKLVFIFRLFSWGPLETLPAHQFSWKTSADASSFPTAGLWSTSSRILQELPSSFGFAQVPDFGFLPEPSNQT